MDFDIYIGTILIWPMNWAPRGWVVCDGRLLTISQNQALYSLLGVQYGGDGKTTFAVPDLRGQVIVGAGVSPKTGKNYMFASKGGIETVTLTADNLPIHTHPATLSGTAGAPQLQASTNVPGNTYVPSDANKYLAASPAGSLGAQMWANTLTAPVNVGGLTGGNLAGSVTVGNNATKGTPIPTQPPYLTLNFIIATQGIYPTRD